eukprot:TRINITY_DN2441_c0_g6_i1.p1 TRINITY_DN2441_c0_g6~~TRINITY_DN2441_c0_g6_i1.p1  ORF type:complete len:213 (-),score=55.47 TRINITY_DN2441_c0_g6_i1:143-781(-)
MGAVGAILATIAGGITAGAVTAFDTLQIPLLLSLFGGTALIPFLTACSLQPMTAAQKSVQHTLSRGMGSNSIDAIERDLDALVDSAGSHLPILPLLFVLLLPVLLAVFFGMNILLAVIIGALLSEVPKLFTLSPSCGLLSSVADLLDDYSLKGIYREAGVVRSSKLSKTIGVGLREPYAAALILFGPTLAIVTLYMAELATKTGLLAKELGL